MAGAPFVAALGPRRIVFRQVQPPADGAAARLLPLIELVFQLQWSLLISNTTV